ncbi:MAG: RNA polymerase sigma factor [Oscillospiraceae bacterium]
MQDFDVIYRENADIVYRYLFSLSHDADLAEELTQQTFFEAIRTAGRFRGNAALATYLCAIAKNLLKKEWARRSKHTHQTLEEIEAVALGNQTETDVLAALSRSEMFRRIHELPEKMREVIYLRLSGELPFSEIGEIMGESETWARVTFYRAKQKLKEACK